MKPMIFKVLGAVAIALLVSTGTQAATVNISTGVATYGLIGPNSLSTTAATITPHNNWASGSGTWIGVPGTNANTTSNDVGTYVFTYLFNLATEAEVNSALISGTIGSDNGSQIQLNTGAANNTGAGYQASQLKTFTVTTGFLLGQNALKIIVDNANCGGCTNPMGLLITGTLSAVPLPAAAWLFGSALLGLVVVARRKAAA